MAQEMALKTKNTNRIDGVIRVVCRCFNVSEAKIRDAIELYGSTEVAQVTEQTRAGGGCNACHCRIQRMLEGKRPTCTMFESCGTCGFRVQQCECDGK
ncbi:MAG: hypothetical protein CMJ77_02280 [Planctomycetaceae bacterium]|nr:hypothetical protein [Planctomycetaceae bacterium]